MPKWLAKEYGPFTGTVWVVVIVGGVGLGLLMRRYMATRGGDTVEYPTTTTPEYAGTSPVITGTGTLYNQGEIVSDVLEALKTQTPPPASTDPTTVTPGPAGSAAGIRAEISRLQAIRNDLIADRNAIPSPRNAANQAKYVTLTARINELATRIYALDAQYDYLVGAAKV